MPSIHVPWPDTFYTEGLNMMLTVLSDLAKWKKTSTEGKNDWSSKSFFKWFLHIRKFLTHTWRVGLTLGCSHVVWSSATDAPKWILASGWDLHPPLRKTPIRCIWQVFLYEITLPNQILKGFSSVCLCVCAYERERETEKEEQDFFWIRIVHNTSNLSV